MVLGASIRRCLPRLRLVDSRAFLSSSNSPEQFKASRTNFVHHTHPTHQIWPYLFAAAATTTSLSNDGPTDAQCSPPDAFASHSKGGRRSRHDADTYLLDFEDPNDRAFDLATTRGFGIEDAREYAGAKSTISYQDLYQRVRRWNDQQKLSEKEEEDKRYAAQCIVNMRCVSNDTSKGGEVFHCLFHSPDLYCNEKSKGGEGYPSLGFGPHHF